jgi:predicted permease
MSWPRALAARFRSLFNRNRLDDELDDEVRFHLEMQAEDNVRAGMDPAEAHYSARRAFGGVEAMKEQYREWRAVTVIETAVRDMAYARRTMRRNPVFCLTVILTLALGIGANTAIFTLLHGLLLRSLPVQQPSRLARIDIVLPATGQEWGLDWGIYQKILRQQRSFSRMSAWVPGHNEALPDSEGTVRRYNVALVSGDGFPVLGIRPYLGRLIERDDDVRGGPSEGWSAVLSYDFWMERFAGNPAILGKPIRLQKTSATVVGIAPAGFRGVTPGLNPSVYLPYQMHTILDGDSRDLDYGCNVIARLAPGTILTTANAELGVYQKDIFDRAFAPRVTRSPAFKGATLHASSAAAGLAWFARQYRQPLFLMQGLAGVVLLLCCVNVGGLMMSKVYARRHEFAIRKAIGGARLRLVRQYLLESLAIALTGAALGAVGAWFGSAALLRFFLDPDQTEKLAVHPDATVLFVTGGLAVCATILFGTLPAWQAGRSDPGGLLTSRNKLGGRRQVAGLAFVPIQIALSLVLATAAGLLSQSLIHLRGEHLGFDAVHVITQSPGFYHQLPQKDDDTFLDVYQRIVDRLEGLPGIQSAAITGNRPTEHGVSSRFQASGTQNSGDSLMAYNHVGPGYFRTMQTRILAGREFERRERERIVCVINESAARHLFPNRQPIGQSVESTSGDKKLPAAACRIIGVVEDARSRDLREPAPPTIYFPVTKEAIAVHGNFTFLMRAAHETDAIAAYRKAAAEIVPTIPVLRFTTLQQQIDEAFGRERLITLMTNLFGVIALLLSAIGLYGLLSSSVTQRTGEMGVRLALGAPPKSVQWIILKEAFIFLAAGVVLGGALLYATVRFFQGMLYRISAFDPVTLLTVISLLVVVAFVAAFMPALRASRVDPMVALRCE